jgi:hypothetical protein
MDITPANAAGSNADPGLAGAGLGEVNFRQAQASGGIQHQGFHRHVSLFFEMKGAPGQLLLGQREPLETLFVRYCQDKKPSVNRQWRPFFAKTDHFHGRCIGAC